MNPNDPNDQNSNPPTSSPFDASQAFAPTSSDSSSWTPPSVGGPQPQETPPPVMPSMPQDTNPTTAADTSPVWAPPTDLSQSAQDSSPAAPTSNPFLSAGEPSSSAGEPSSSPTPDTGYASPEFPPIEPTPTFITQGQESLGVDTSSTPFQPTPPSAMDNQSGFMPSAQPQDTTSEAAHPELSEPAPTDLSQLAETPTPPPSAEIYTPPVLNPDSLVVPPNTNGVPETISQDEGSSHHIPKIAIIGAVIVILVVAAASAYFILGIGQPSITTPTTEQAPLTNPPSQTNTGSQTISTPAPTPVIDSSGGSSSSFGDINGDTNATDQTPAATIGPSAIDQIKARQSAVPTPTPIPN